MDIHKRTINYCVKTGDGKIVEEGRIVASKDKLKSWAEARWQPWVGAMEATLFTHWVYDVLRPYAAELKVANPLLLKAITAVKKKNDRVDARMLADLLRCDLLPECYTMPAELRDLRRGDCQDSGLGGGGRSPFAILKCHPDAHGLSSLPVSPDPEA